MNSTSFDPMRNIVADVDIFRSGHFESPFALLLMQNLREMISSVFLLFYVSDLGKHEERKDEHGFVSRCFTRKYT